MTSTEKNKPLPWGFVIEKEVEHDGPSIFTSRRVVSPEGEKSTWCSTTYHPLRMVRPPSPWGQILETAQGKIKREISGYALSAAADMNMSWIESLAALDYDMFGLSWETRPDNQSTDLPLWESKARPITVLRKIDVYRSYGSSWDEKAKKEEERLRNEFNFEPQHLTFWKETEGILRREVHFFTLLLRSRHQ